MIATIERVSDWGWDEDDKREEREIKTISDLKTLYEEEKHGLIISFGDDRMFVTIYDDYIE